LNRDFTEFFFKVCPIDLLHSIKIAKQTFCRKFSRLTRANNELILLDFGKFLQHFQITESFSLKKITSTLVVGLAPASQPDCLLRTPGQQNEPQK
jgi:hypothetical protein